MSLLAKDNRYSPFSTDSFIIFHAVIMVYCAVIYCAGLELIISSFSDENNETQLVSIDLRRGLTSTVLDPIHQSGFLTQSTGRDSFVKVVTCHCV